MTHVTTQVVHRKLPIYKSYGEQQATKNSNSTDSAGNLVQWPLRLHELRLKAAESLLAAG